LGKKKKKEKLLNVVYICILPVKHEIFNLIGFQMPHSTHGCNVLPLRE